MKNALKQYVAIVCVMIFGAVTVFFSQEKKIVDKNASENKQTTSPALMIQGENGEQKPLHLRKLSISAEVVGNFAVTTIDMTFYNDLDRVLEGELVFPLGEGQTVSRFAMELGGVLREGVVVEKAQGRKVFEEIVRRRIDPALLEMTVGNTFRSRVYPIPAKGTKRIVMAYEQELRRSEEGQVFTLPMEYNDPIDTFLLHAELKNITQAPDMRKNVFENIRFERLQKNFIADFSAHSFTANKPLTVLMPAGIENTMQVFTGKRERDSYTYFYINGVPQAEEKQKTLPKSIVLMWDNSGSSAQNDKTKILDALDEYITMCGNCSVRLFEFAIKPTELGTFTIANGNTVPLRTRIEQLIPDGATRLHSLDFKNFAADEIILVTDGVQTFDKGDIGIGKTPITVLNANQIAEHGFLRKTALATGGQYINCAGMQTDEIIKQMTTLPLQFIRAIPSAQAETYPSLAQPIRGDFSIAGRSTANTMTVTLQFGFGNKVTYEKSIVVSNENAVQSHTTPRLWAQKKLTELDMEFEKNKKAITDLGKEFSIVTKTTSLIVLEQISDYVKYRIVPPTDDMKTEYYRLVQMEDNNKKVQSDNSMEQIVAMTNRRKGWYDVDFQKKIEEEKKEYERNLRIQKEIKMEEEGKIEKILRRRDSLAKTITIANQKGGWGSINGVVTSKGGNPVQRATVNVLKTKKGGITKANGSFVIEKIDAGERILEVRAVNYYPTYCKVNVAKGDNVTLNIYLDTAVNYTSVVNVVSDRYKEMLSQEQKGTTRQRSGENNRKSAGESVQAVALGVGAQQDNGGVVVRGSRSDRTQDRVGGLDIGDQFEVGEGTISALMRSSAVASDKIANGAITQDKIVNTEDEFKRLNQPSSRETVLHWDGTEILGSDDVSSSTPRLVMRNGGTSDRLSYPIDGDTTGVNGRGLFSSAVGSASGKVVNLRPNRLINGIDPSGDGSYGWLSRPSNEPAGGDLTGDFPNPVTRDDVVRSNRVFDSAKSKPKKRSSYLDTLRVCNINSMYAAYLRLRRLYSNDASFYAEAADIFMERGQKEHALRIISNLAELKIESQRLLRILGRRLLRYGFNEEAIYIFREVRSIREEEPQSMRDLGLALVAGGKYQEAVDTLYAMALRKWDRRFPEVESIALNEMNAVINKAGKSVQTNAIDKRLLYNHPLDLRIVLDWDADNSDIDLWVIDPNGEKCFYSHPTTKIGGKLSKDLTGGYGPEEFTLKNAIPGTYTIKVHYYGDRQQSIAGPTTINVQVFTDYGKATEKKRDISMRMKSTQEVVDVGDVVIGKK